MKNILILLILPTLGISNSFGKDFSCPEKFDVSLQNTKYPDFEIFPTQMEYPLASAILYSGHPKELVALKGDSQDRKMKDRPFWLVCNYQLNEKLWLPYKLTKKIPLEFTKCKYFNDFKNVDCEKGTN